ncbi:MAG: universal stress protein [Alphaproteobacteria bacterium]|nr:universal stress protein [Alphaproteobacteria bacterium]
MSYKTIMVCLNELPANARVMDVAAQLGVKFKAHVRGVYVIPGAQVFGGEAYTLTPIVFDATRVFFQEQKEKVRAAFEGAMKAQGVTFDFEVVDSNLPNITQEVISASRSADLLVISALPANGDDNIEDDLVERTILAAGCPVLVLPAGGTFTFNADEVVLGWDASREAARALHDALPFFKGSRLVRICSVDAAPDGTVPGADVAESLDRHGIKASVEKVSSDGRNAGATLLRAANDFGAGLLVMGCYGHGRFSEFVFGGATRHVLASLDRAVLMSH